MSVILVGVDASERSEDAVDFTQHLARATGAHVVVTSVFPYDDGPSLAPNVAYRSAMRRDAEDTVRTMARRFDLGDRVRTITVGRTSPAHGLQDIAKSEHAALIVVGSSHVGVAGRVLPGSTAERLLHGAPCPVAVVPKHYRVAETHALRKIGVAYDGSPESTAAVEAAIEVVRATAGELRVIHVADVMAYGAPAAMGGPSYIQMSDEIDRETAEQLDQRVARLPEDVYGTGVLRAGDPARELVAQSHGLDVLVTGSRRYGPLRAVLLGGVTGRLLREIACPVVVVPRGVETPLAGLFGAAAQAPA